MVDSLNREFRFPTATEDVTAAVKADLGTYTRMWYFPSTAEVIQRRQPALTAR